MKIWLYSFTCLALLSCQSTDRGDWPDTLPSQEYFVAAYYADSINQELQSEDAYLGWIRSFYEGNLMSPTGWLQMQSLVLANATPADRATIESRLDQLGAAIAAEWAKENRGRAIDSRMLSLWASLLQLAADATQQQRTIDVIATDVEDLLAGALSRDVIQESRYERLLGVEFFSGF